MVRHCLRHFTSIEQTLPLLKALRLLLTNAPYERARFIKLLSPVNDILSIVKQA